MMRQVGVMSLKDKDFFVQLGKRIAKFRKEAGFSQTELAQTLNCSQQHLLSFEKGRYRVPANLLPVMAKLFGVTLDELLGVDSKPARPRRPSKLERQLEQLSELPKSKRKLVSEMLDGILQQAS